MPLPIFKNSGHESAQKPTEIKSTERDRMSDDVTDSLGILLESIDGKVNRRIDQTVEEKFTFIEKLAKNGSKLTIKNGDKTSEITGSRHKQLTDLITILGAGLPTLMVGPAGTGKTHAAKQAADALGFKFYAMSVGAQTSKADIIGYMSASGHYVTTAFRKAYEEGGVFLMDEIDAGNANVIIQVNAALSNGYASFPDKMVDRHENFIFVASANTFGDGASRQYVGRNQLDAATLDRFTFLTWDIDLDLEEILAGSTAEGKKWLKAVRGVRDWAGKNVDRVIVSPRAVERGVALLNAGMPYTKVIDRALLGSFPNDKRQEAARVARNSWGS